MKKAIMTLAGAILCCAPVFSQSLTYGEAVSRNEFGCYTGVFPSPDGTLEAVYTKDESEVSDFPLLDITTRTGSLISIKYPMNGMPSEKLALCVRDTLGNILSTMKVTDFTDERYLTGVTWSPDGKYIFIQVLDRSQHHLKLNMYRAMDGTFVRTILTEDNDAWVEPLDPLHFVKGTYSFIYRTDNRDGYRNLYLCDTLGTVERLTKVDADVEYAGNDGRYLYYTSAEVSPVENHLFRIDMKHTRKPPVRLTAESGWHDVKVDDACSTFRDRWSSVDEFWKIAVKSCSDGGIISQKPSPKDAETHSLVELGTVRSADGLYDNYYRIVKPEGFDSTKTYPMVLYVYGGPHSQMVTDSWRAQSRVWEDMMARRGYVVYVQDNRGTQRRGAAFEKAINRACGKAEAADQMVGVRMMLGKSWIDSSRVGVYGWSYGGFMTITLKTAHPDIFKVAVAGGPVIDWKWYEVMYGERYMDTPESNPEGFEATSLMNRTGDVSGKLLIIQGAIDKTVVWQHSLNFVQKCIENDIQVDYFPYPRSAHNVSGPWRKHLQEKICTYFEENL